MLTKFGAAAFALGVVFSSAMLDARPAQAQSWASPFPWCAQWSGAWGGARECAYYTFEQCRASVFGAGGGCYPNPAYVAPVPEYVPARKPRRRHY
jgi:hypothetical protein